MTQADDNACAASSCSWLQELESVGYSWERAKTLTNNHVHWRVPLDALCSPEGDKG